jgi:hypothetical protein
LHEEPYTTEEIEGIVQQSLQSIMAKSPSTLAVLAAAKSFKLLQVIQTSLEIIPYCLPKKWLPVKDTGNGKTCFCCYGLGLIFSFLSFKPGWTSFDILRHGQYSSNLCLCLLGSKHIEDLC